MALLISAIVIGLVAWALRLMEKAVENQEFSLMLAGFLVASSAAAMISVYFLMGNYMVFIAHASAPEYSEAVTLEGEQILPVWVIQSEG